MAERITIAELDLDVQGLLKKSSETKLEILQLRDAQKELRKSGQEASAEFIANEARLKNLTATYNAQTAAIRVQAAESGKLQSQQAAITATVDKLNQSEREYMENNKALKELRKDLNKADADYQKNLDAINAKINENDEFLKSNRSNLEAQRMSVGGYADGIREALADTGLFNGALGAMGADAGGVINIFQSFSPVLNTLHQQFNTIIGDAGLFGQASDRATQATQQTAAASGQLTGAQRGQAAATGAATTATNIGTKALHLMKLALMSLGIGLIIAAILILVAAFKSFTPLIDKVEQGMAAVGAAFKVVLNAVTAFITGAKSLSEAFSGLGDSMAQAAKDAAKLKKAQQDLEDAMAIQEVQTARNRAAIDKLNTQAKDRTKTEEERLALLEEAARLEKQDYQERKKNADEALRIAYEQIRIEAELNAEEMEQLKEKGLKYKDYVEQRTSGVDELFDALKKAQIAQAEMDGEFNTLLEKNINKQNKIIEDKEAREAKAAEERKKAIDAAQKAEEERQKRAEQALQAAAQKSKLLLDDFISQQGVRAKSLEEELNMAEYIYKQKLVIAQKDFEASKKTENDKLALKIATNDALNEFNKKSAEISIAFAEQELKRAVDNSQAILDNDKFLNESLFNQKKKALDDMAQAERDYYKIMLDEGAINQQRYNEEINKINTQNREEQSALADERKLAENEKQLLDLENKKIAEEENFIAQMELERERLEIQRNQEIAEAEKTGADVQIIKDKYAALDKKITKDVEDFKMQQRMAVLSGIKGLFGEESKIGKAVAVAEIVNSTVSNAAKAFNQAAVFASNPVTAALAPNAAIQGGIIIATGAMQVAKTVGAKFEKGGLQEIGGNRHSAGGTKFIGEDGTAFEAEQGELIGVMNRNAARHFMAFNNSFSSGGGSSFNNFASGGIVSREIAQPGLDIDVLVAKLAEANQALPSPVVAVTDIITEGNNYAKVVQGANF